MYTSALDVLSLAANPVSSIGGVYQNVEDNGIITNMYDEFLKSQLPVTRKLSKS